jgi:hypothetical protein
VTRPAPCHAALVLALLLAAASGAAGAPARPTILLLVTERVLGVFGTTGYEQPRHVEALLARALVERGFAVVDLDAAQRASSRAKTRQLLEGDELAAREVALQQEALYLLVGSATSKPAGGKLFGSELQSLQGSVTLRLIRSGDGSVVGTASGQAAQAHLDEVQGGLLALSKATEAVLAQLAPAFAALVREAAAGPGEVTLQVKGLVSFQHLDHLMGSFARDLPGIEGARLLGFHGGVAEVALTTRTDAASAARSLGNARFTGFRLRVTHVEAARIELEVVLEE